MAFISGNLGKQAEFAMSDAVLRVGMLGLGKLGLPVAAAMAWAGAEVIGYDIDPKRMRFDLVRHPVLETGPEGAGEFGDILLRLRDRHAPSGGSLRFEPRFREFLESAGDLIFIAVPTPHRPGFGFDGERPLMAAPEDFDYGDLASVVHGIAVSGFVSGGTVAIISTVLPGTCGRLLAPQIPPHWGWVYNPSFIAMGTTMRDFLDPEFVLLGLDAHVGDVIARARVDGFYAQLLPQARRLWMSVASAELTKMLYNTWITQKILLANTAMEIAHAIPGAHVDEVTGALRLATRRIASPAYMDAGMGDGGGCHPRDNVALAALAQQLRLSYDPFLSAVVGRERQTLWLGQIIAQVRRETPALAAAPVHVLGYAYKPASNLTLGSPAFLLAHYLMAIGIPVECWDPYVRAEDAGSLCVPADGPALAVLGCRHPTFVGWEARNLPPGSVLVDPFRIARPHAGVRYVPLGIGPGR